MDDPVIDPDIILSFCDIVAAEPRIAVQYLKLFDSNLELAVQFYMENGGAPLGPNSSSTTQAATSSTASANTHSILNPSGNDNATNNLLAELDDDDELSITGNRIPPPPPQSTQSPTNRPVSNVNQYDSEGYRAPIAPWRETLSGGYDIFSDVDNGIPRPTVFRESTEPFRILSDEANALEGQYTSQGDKLAELFRPPFDIISDGDFEKNRNIAKQTSKWMMVNIQDPSEFPCQVLNRDLWRDKDVKSLVKENFIFCQYYHESSDGKRYKSFYPFSSFPHFSIIDPRTGERLMEFNVLISPAEFISEATEFLMSHSLNSTSLPTLVPTPSKFQPPPSEAKKQRKKISEMTEDEQLEAALAASLEDSSASPSSKAGSQKPESNNSEDDVIIMSSRPHGKGKAVEVVHLDDDHPSTISTDPVDIVAKIQAKLHPEPAGSEGVTRIQIRLPDGSRKVRKFKLDDPIRTVFEYIKADVPDAQKHAFELVYLRDSLVEKLDQTLAAVGLQNASLILQYL